MLTGGLAERERVFSSFLGHCLRRALFVRRTMLQFVSFDEMLSRISPIAEREPMRPTQIPEGWIVRAAEWCACLFPRLWRRRCLFRSLLVLDWARQLGIDPVLNVGMELGPRRDQGHCWLSIGNRPFCEAGGWPKRYGVLFHRSCGLRHWTSLTPNGLGAATFGGDSEKRGANE